MLQQDTSSNKKTPGRSLLNNIQKFFSGADNVKQSAHLATTDNEPVNESPIKVVGVYDGNPIVHIQQGKDIIEARRHVSTYLPGNKLAVGDEIEITGYEIGNCPIVQKKETMNFHAENTLAKIVAPELWLPKQKAV